MDRSIEGLATRLAQAALVVAVATPYLTVLALSFAVALPVVLVWEGVDR